MHQNHARIKRSSEETSQEELRMDAVNKLDSYTQYMCLNANSLSYGILHQCKGQRGGGKRQRHGGGKKKNKMAFNSPFFILTLVLIFTYRICWDCESAVLCVAAKL